MAPRWAKKDPKGAMWSPRGDSGGPQCAPEAPKGAKRRPRWPPEGALATRRGPKRTKIGQEGAKNAKIEAMKSIKDIFLVL